MSQILPFPTDEESLLKLSVQEIQAKNYSKACAHLRQVLSLQPLHAEACATLLEVYAYLKDINSLKEIWHAYGQTILAQTVDSDFIQTAIHLVDQIYPLDEAIIQLMELRLQLLDRKVQLNEDLNDYLLQKSQQLKLLQKIRDKKELSKSINSLGTLNFSERFSLMQRLQEQNPLPYQDFLQEVLRSNFEAPIKALAVDSLCRTQLAEVTYYPPPNNEPIIIDLSLLDAIDSHPYQEEIKEAVQHYCQDFNPHLEDSLTDLVQKQLLYLYPFWDDLVEADQWIELNLQAMDLLEVPSQLPTQIKDAQALLKESTQFWLTHEIKG